MQRVIKYNLMKIALLAVIIFASIKVFPQFNNILYGFDRIPQSNYLNPASVPEAKLVVGIPVLSSFSASFYSTGFSFNDLFEEKGDSLYLNLAPIIDKSGSVNYLSGVIDVDLIYVGVKLKKGFLNLGVRNRIFAQTFYATDLLRLAWYGNNPYVGENLDLDQTWVSTDHFNAWYVGYAFTVADKVDLGLRLNINQGMSNIQTKKHNISLLTSENSTSVYDVYAKTDYLVNTSGLSGDFNVSDYFFNMQNFGISFDIGAHWDINKSFAVNLSVLDLGFITWNSGLKNYQSKYDSVYFSGIYADIDDENFDISKVFSDTLQELFDVIETESKYTASLPTRLIIGGEYYFGERTIRVNLLLSARVIKNYFDPSVTAGFDMKVSNHFAFKATYTYLRHSPFNVGLGLVVDVRPFQLYVMTDNIITAFNWEGAQYFNLHFGINLIWPRFKKMEQNPE